ncbi:MULTISPECIES: hypothetical protein [unclassified Herbaspirillum]|uniref:hypothetical protein n=1 Tax=unclassified Herbaspirillum TaxID=2624150 RepID=UPI00115170E4|nr:MULTISPECIES: hypothetical protein [unclassified Herbaspirillum]MBB5393303.1 hypothetical protein [Herbaspirillum sp. SJZ102]TQK03948.1 hypothetical protein FB599_3518 [Herbaspirillum sp. SJZ130]TQK08680.1 hypothetical protein FB598_3457 [Herbaspirillum sp. SJZ106]TWC71951.1 hypothetical protein FB597_101936 [Herbaspirillum sp. SJZ099]
MDKSDSAHPTDKNISIQQGDWDAYRNHIGSHAADPQKTPDECEEEIRSAPAGAPGDSSGQPLHGEEDILAYRRQCARAYIGMNGRLGGRAYHANEPVILTPETVNELAELNRILREERAQKKKGR